MILIILLSLILNKILITIIPILLIPFFSKHILIFYLIFEAVPIPTVILITLNGKQPEQLQERIYLLTL